MEQKITMDKDTFSYVNNGTFIRITGYSYEGEKLPFAGEEDGKERFHIHIPESILGLPVLVVDKLSFSPAMLPEEYSLKQFMRGEIVFHLPEYTGFVGVETYKIEPPFQYFTPAYRIKYFSRQDRFFSRTEGAYRFFAQELTANACSILWIHWDPSFKTEAVRSSGLSRIEPAGSSIEKLVIPSHIGDFAVAELSRDSTLAVPLGLREIHIPEGICDIGEKCFSDLPKLEEVFLPESLQRIGAGAFSYYHRTEILVASADISSTLDELCAQVPKLSVCLKGSKPDIGENAFARRTVADIYEQFDGWGIMATGQKTVTHDVVYLETPSTSYAPM